MYRVKFGVAEGPSSLAERIMRCTACSLHTRRLHTPGNGSPASGIMLVEEAPSISAGRARRHLYTRRGPSKAYRLLDRVLRRALGVGLDQAYLTSLVKCPAPGMGEPREDQLSACRPFLDEEQRMVAPRLLIALGRNVSRRLVDPGISSIGRGRGVLVRRLDGVLVVSTYHPAYALGRGLEEEMVEDLARAARELGAASGQTG